jgi:predicted dehydrogenase
VTGTDAVVSIDGNRVTVYGAGDADADRLRAVIQDTPHSNDPQERAIADIVRAYRTGEPSRIEGTHGRAATEIIMAAYQSARTGEVVTLPLADRSIDLRPAVSVG